LVGLRVIKDGRTGYPTNACWSLPSLFFSSIIRSRFPRVSLRT